VQRSESCGTQVAAGVSLNGQLRPVARAFRWTRAVAARGQDGRADRFATQSFRGALRSSQAPRAELAGRLRSSTRRTVPMSSLSISLARNARRARGNRRWWSSNFGQTCFAVVVYGSSPDVRDAVHEVMEAGSASPCHGVRLSFVDGGDVLTTTCIGSASSHGHLLAAQIQSRPRVSQSASTSKSEVLLVLYVHRL